MMGPFRLVRQLGKGGYADVYLADDTVLGRQVAVKIARLATHFATCQREYERQVSTIAARIDHPNIVRIYGNGEVNGVPYLSMEYVDGETLLRILRRRVRLRWPEALQVARDVVQGLAAAHRLRVVHRDVKPDNILVTRDGVAKLTDFYADDSENLRNELGTYDYFGTPGYSAPEQVRGEEHRIDGRTDLFAVGVILYEMLQGEPYHGRGRTTRLIARTLRPAVIARLRRSQDVPGPVARLVNQLVHSSPRRRPADAVATLALIERALERCA
jgi:serine/threonine-protein kinase